MMQSEQPSAVPPGRIDPSLVPILDEDDDFELGFECANPALQIERWGQDETALY